MQNFNFFVDKNRGLEYNVVMENKDIDILTVNPDPITGKLPTKKQLEVLTLLNPLKYPGMKNKEVGLLLGISAKAAQDRMSTLKKRCPDIYDKFRKLRFEKKEVKHRYKTGCKDCGTDIPYGQDICFRCWRSRDKKLNPKAYKQDRMFPANGPTKSTIDWDKWEDNDLMDWAFWRKY